MPRIYRVLFSPPLFYGFLEAEHQGIERLNNWGLIVTFEGKYLNIGRDGVGRNFVILIYRMDRISNISEGIYKIRVVNVERS